MADTAISYSSAFPYLAALSAVAVLSAFGNLVWSIAQAIKANRANTYNIALCVCSFIFFAHVGTFLGEQVYMYNQIKASQKRDRQVIQKFGLILRCTWAASSIIYLMIVQSRFGIVLRNKARKTLYQGLLMAVTICVWIPYGLVFTGIAIAGKVEDLNLTSVTETYDRFYDTYFVCIDIFMGIYILKYILRFAAALKKQHLPTVSAQLGISDIRNSQEHALLYSLTRNVSIWTGIGVLWICVTFINMGNWGPDLQTQGVILYLLVAFSMVLNALQFSFAMLWLNNLKNLLSLTSSDSHDYKSDSSKMYS